MIFRHALSKSDVSGLTSKAGSVNSVAIYSPAAKWSPPSVSLGLRNGKQQEYCCGNIPNLKSSFIKLDTLTVEVDPFTFFIGAKNMSKFHLLGWFMWVLTWLINGRPIPLGYDFFLTIKQHQKLLLAVIIENYLSERLPSPINTVLKNRKIGLKPMHNTVLMP